MTNFYVLNNRVLSHIIFWLFILFFYTFFQSFYNGHFFHILKTNLFYFPQDIISVYFVLYVLFPRFLLKFKLLLFLLFSLITILFLTFLSVFVTYYVLPSLELYTPPISVDEQFSNTIFALTGITGMAATLKYIKLSFVNQYVNKEISMKQMETELKYLRSQINPHFLFNSLNNIDELIYDSPKKASKAIFLLSEILRYVLKESEFPEVSLLKEIDFLKHYKDFVSLGFKSKNFIEFHIVGHCPEIEIPPLLFLPIIENAVKYANRKKESPCIVIYFYFHLNSIEFSVSNYISSDIPFEMQNKTGLKNLKRRLELSFKDNYKLKINEENKVYHINLKINLK